MGRKHELKEQKWKKEEYKQVAEIKGIWYLCQHIINWDEHLEQYKYHKK